MPESADNESVLKRVENYRQTVENMVLQGIEHPTCELKRAVTISKDNLPDRFDFVKLVQGVANSHKTVECLIVIGADEKQKKFFTVDNADEFDAAKLSQVLRKYLSPEPEFEVFNDVRASTGERYVLIVINRLQPRPIVVCADGQVGMKTYLRPGEMWIKSKTELRNATKSDMDLMYEAAIAHEAEKRARFAVEHLKQDLGPANLAPATNPIPVPELLLGSREVLKRFIEARLALKELTPFAMLLEMARNTIVVKWNTLNSGYYYAQGVLDEEHEAYLSTYSAEYLPVLQSVIDMGLIVSMYQGPSEWHKRVVDLLVEAFESAGQINRLVAFRDSEESRKLQPYAYPERAEGYQITPLTIGRPAYEVYLGARILATYAVMRKKPEYLTNLLSRFVRTVTEDRYRETTQPLLFWPFAGDLGLPPMMDGRNEDYWRQRVSLSWPAEFSSKDGFLNAAAGLELILELNSHLFVYDTYAEIKAYKQKNHKRRYEYFPDFWKTRLDPALPTAEWIYERLTKEKSFPSPITLAPDVVQKVFEDKNVGERAVFFGEFLFKLKQWQNEARLQQRMFPLDLTWPDELKAAIDKYKASLPPKE